MSLPRESELLRIYIGEQDRLDGRPLYERILEEARNRGLAGATVLRGVMGYGANSRQIQTFKIERLSEDLPVVVEIVDTEENLEKFLDTVGPQIPAGLVTMEKAQVKFYRFEKK